MTLRTLLFGRWLTLPAASPPPRPLPAPELLAITGAVRDAASTTLSKRT